MHQVTGPNTTCVIRKEGTAKPLWMFEPLTKMRTVVEHVYKPEKAQPPLFSSSLNLVFLSGSVAIRIQSRQPCVHIRLLLVSYKSVAIQICTFFNRWTRVGLMCQDPACSTGLLDSILCNSQVIGFGMFHNRQTSWKMFQWLIIYCSLYETP